AYDVQRYIDFFKRPAVQGGAKDDPLDVILFAIDGPETPFSTFLYDPAQGNAPYHACATPTLSGNCVEALQHSCENHVQPGFFADPALRIGSVVRAVGNCSDVSSICGDDLSQPPDFTRAMQTIGDCISTAIQPACLNGPVVNRTDGIPDC